MRQTLLFAAVVSLAGASAAFADDDDCRSPMSAWQPREAVVDFVTTLGISVERLRIDDGCYEIRGRDGDGNRVGLQLDPATLAVRELAVRFRDGADATPYLRHGRGPDAGGN